MPEPTRPAPVCFRDRAVERELAARSRDASSGQVAARDLGRYYEALRRELATVDLDEAEASLICDALNGVMLLEPMSVGWIWAEVADHVRLDDAATKWFGPGAEGHFRAGALVEKLRSLSYAQKLAIRDAVERFWQAPDRPTGEMLRAVGLVREPPPIG